ncbi:aldo/keto reductase [Streptacidiphilus monticola]
MDAVRDVLTSGGRTLAQGALAWLLARSPAGIPIPGCRTVAQVEENLGVLASGPLTPRSSLRSKRPCAGSRSRGTRKGGAAGHGRGPSRLLWCDRGATGHDRPMLLTTRVRRWWRWPVAPPPTVPPSAPPTFRCPGCGRESRSDARTCPTCDRRLE